MKSVRKFFGHLCGRSGRRIDQNKGDSPLSPSRDDEEKQVEPTLLADDDVQVEVGNKEETLKEYFTQSSYESLTESPSSRRKQNAVKPASAVHIVYDVTEWKPENLGVPGADKAFNDAVEALGPFYTDAEDMAKLLLKFCRQYSKDKKPDFLKCFQVYLKNKAKEGSDDPGGDDDPTAKQLKEIAVKGKKLLELIDKIKPQVAERISEASKYDVKEAGKESRDSSSSHQGGLLSKFSAPGKFRRNLKQLKENHRLLDLVRAEVESILLAIGNGWTKIENPTTAIEDSDRSGSRTLLSQVKSEEPVCPNDIVIIADAHSERPSDTTEQIGPDKMEVIQDECFKSGEEVEICPKDDSPEIIDEKQPEIIDERSFATNDEAPKIEPGPTEPIHADLADHEHADVILPLRSDSPAMLQGHAKGSSLDKVDSSRLLDFGSYIFVDPSMNDEVVMRASRSLDSLCSVSSRRTLSLYGSYEFVTDFELKIAEKAEDQKQKMTESRTPKKAKNKRTKKPKSGKTSGSREASSPIYKYTELDYNPLGL